MTQESKLALCGCCGESLALLYKIEEGKEVCLDCKKVYESGRCHRWDQIATISRAIKDERRQPKGRSLY